MKANLTKMIVTTLVLLGCMALSAGPLNAKENWQALDGFTPLTSELTQFGKNYVGSRTLIGKKP